MKISFIWFTASHYIGRISISLVVASASITSCCKVLYHDTTCDITIGVHPFDSHTYHYSR
ncbi:hypothetical protein L873DRAFT_440857 [Choiromyces venosus 120613-1]|uniref:Uncharacterized protein n=1 Tax=Choiromyces venosus 120613-1 TaxID=1336337 RepID=A0A3N4J9B1_9PEZI|nr:hypothetical protein L873DRAFT_440857 [Choiromyces venosus 120613-1]